jgi:hypothetical protein
MGWFSGDDRPKEEKLADIDRHKATKKAQENYRPKDREESPTTRQLNDARIEAEQYVSRWRR